MAIINRIKINRTARAQAMVEFALAVPILLIIIFGLIEVGRLIFFNTTIISAAREGARYASATGAIGGTVQYRDCNAIIAATRNVDVLNFINDIKIQYDHGPGTTPFANCSSSIVLNSGDRVVVTVSGDFTLMAGIVPGLSSHTFSSTSERTILGKVKVVGSVAELPPGLTVTVYGNGTVTSSDGKITCTSTCSETYANGDVITLTASPSSLFSGWGGACASSGSSPTCSVAISGETEVTASFAGPFKLTVNKTGTGTGTVMSDESPTAYINCGSTCSYNDYPNNAGVTLTATWDPATSSFGGWAGCDSDSGNTCTVNMDSDHTITANFGPPGYQVILTMDGVGSGHVESTNPTGMDCSASCVKTFPLSTTQVDLQASAYGGSIFIDWPVCPGTVSGNICSIPLTGNVAVTANFDTAEKMLTVSKTGTGIGTVTSDPAGIACGATCSNPFPTGQAVILTPTWDPANSAFTGWTGCDSVTSNKCNVLMSAIKSVSANFNDTTHQTLTVNLTGTGGGNVVSTPAGIGCPGICSFSFLNNTSVLLTATKNSNSLDPVFTGCDSVSGATCTVAMNNYPLGRTVTVKFDKKPMPPCKFTQILPPAWDNSAKTVTWTITNVGNGIDPTPNVEIEHLYVLWDGGNLTLITIDGVTFWGPGDQPKTGLTIMGEGKTLSPGIHHIIFSYPNPTSLKGHNFMAEFIFVPTNCVPLSTGSFTP